MPNYVAVYICKVCFRHIVVKKGLSRGLLSSISLYFFYLCGISFRSLISNSFDIKQLTLYSNIGLRCESLRHGSSRRKRCCFFKVLLCFVLFRSITTVYFSLNFPKSKRFLNYVSLSSHPRYGIMLSSKICIFFSLITHIVPYICIKGIKINIFSCSFLVRWVSLVKLSFPCFKWLL